jgi:predicted PurR-regulated permease PerM
MAENQVVSQVEVDLQRKRSIVLTLLLVGLTIFTLAALMVPFLSNQIDSQMSSGEVASREIVAPRSLT